MFDEEIYVKGFRNDGWPYCPGCGNDELYLKPNHSVKCYNCGWDEAAPNKSVEVDRAIVCPNCGKSKDIDIYCNHEFHQP